jgi:hypothetical protein
LENPNDLPIRSPPRYDLRVVSQGCTSSVQDSA